MAQKTWSLALFLGLQVVIAIPFNDVTGTAQQLEPESRQLRQQVVEEDFSKGFSKEFSADMPTEEFHGNFHGRQKRQVGVSSAIDGILNSPYGSDLASDHLQALLTRNNFRRPARDSAGSVLGSQPQSSTNQIFQPDFRSQQRQPPLSQSQPQPQLQSQLRPQPQPQSRPQPQLQSQLRPQPQQQSRPQPRPQPQLQSQLRPQPQPQSRPQPRPQPQLQSQLRPQPQSRPQSQSSRPRPISPSFSSQPRQPPPTQRFTPNQPDFSISQGRTKENDFGNRSRPRSPLRTASRRPNVSSRNDEPTQEPFPSATFTGQQFERPFPAFEEFSQSPRQTRQKRQTVQQENVSHKLTEILSSPYEGPIPNSISSLYDRNNRFPRKSQVNDAPSSVQAIENTVTDNQGATPLENPFEIPFEIPNFFEKFGIQKRSVDVASRRQGIADALDDIIRTPYQGNVPASIESLFNSNKNRFVRKIKPSTSSNFISQPVSQGRPVAQENQGINTPRVLASDDPSVAAGRLVPSSQNPNEYSINLGSSHVFYRTSPGRKRRSTIRRQPRHPYVVGRFIRPQAINAHRRIQSNILRPHPNGKKSRGKGQEHDPKANLSRYPVGKKEEESRQNNTLDSLPVNGITPLDFISNFNTPFEFEFEIENLDELEAVSPSKERGVKPSQKPQHAPQIQRPFPLHGRPRPVPFRTPGFRPGPSPPAFILPASSTVRAPRHLLMEYQLLPKTTRQQDIPIQRRSMDVAESGQFVQKVSLDNPAAREDSPGFMEGISFPSFPEIGGFGPMPAKKENAGAESFMVEFKPPVEVEIPDIDDTQPQFNLPQFSQQKHDISTSHHNSRNIQKSASDQIHQRTKRASVPDAAEDISLVPQRRVKRIDTEDTPVQLRTFQDSQAAFSDVPFDIQPFPEFQYPVFQYEKIKPSIIPSREYNVAPYPGRGISRKVEVRTSDDDFIVPESQRFFPNFNPRFTPSHQGPASQSFFPSTLPTPRGPGPRSARFNGHGPGFRESSGVRDNGGFRDFHETFYGPGTREAVNRPDFVFPSSKIPVHRENEALDNTLLGSGNFEVLKGGTFFDDDDPHIYDGYDHDHLLHGDFYGSHSPSHRPHSNNHVDDFFSNFRDFSEFAARRSDEGETMDDHSFYGSEQINHVVNITHPYTPVAFANETKESEEFLAKDSADAKGESNKPEPLHFKATPKISDKESTKHKHFKPHRQPKNIQEVMEDLEVSESNDNMVSSLTSDEKDPMIAMF
ncbi:uncharacterized protein [Palaemon carinicauda]|uniref:uncharacterized protein n=1 Tax=Palaemon carinicauda TaxID=392227 RepID=UPI0035B5FCF4